MRSASGGLENTLTQELHHRVYHLLSYKAALFAVSIAVFVLAWGAGANSSVCAGSESRISKSQEKELLVYWSEHYLSPEEYVLEKFRTKKWVFLGEYHRIRHDVELVSTLIPLLHQNTDVRYLALEFLEVKCTDEANELITADSYDRKKMICFFRKQFPSWPYEEYLGIFRSAWESNKKYAASRGSFRLMGLHPGMDWELINYGTDAESVRREKEKLADYDKIMADSIESGILEKGVKALVFTGIAHSTAKFPEYYLNTHDQLIRMGNIIYREPYKKDMFFICLHAPFWDSGTKREIYPFDGVLDRLMKSFGKDIGFDVMETPFECLGHRERSPRDVTGYLFGQLYDGCIIFKTPIKDYAGVTLIKDWITDEDELRFFWRHLQNIEASQRFSRLSLDEFKKDFYAPSSDHGVEFRRRFQSLPDIK